jgi:hypothetical protein
MVENSLHIPPDIVPTKIPRVDLGYWFLGGFMLIFILWMFTNQYILAPNSQSVIVCTTWQCYYRQILEILGPTMSSSGPGSLSKIAPIALVHLLVSGVGGSVGMGIGAVVRKVF